MINTAIALILFSYILSTSSSPFQKNMQMLSKQIYTLNSNNLSTQGLVIKCFWFETTNFTIFDLKKLENNIDESYSFISKQKKHVHYNFCGNIVKKECNGQDNQVISLDDSKCIALGGPYKTGNTWQLLDPKNYTKGVKITLNSGEKCNDKGTSYSVIYEIQCQASQKEKLILLNSDLFDDTMCINTLQFSSPYGCPDESILSVYRFFENKKFIFASILIILGLFELVLGKKLITPTTYIISASSFTGLVFLFIIQFTIPAHSVNAVLWVVLAISLIVGLVVATLITIYKKTFIGFLLGGFCGYLVGTVIFTAFTCNLFPDYGTLTNIVTVVVSIIVFICLTYFCFEHIIIVGTSLIGGFFVIFGLGIFIGNFPNLSLIMQLIKNGEKEQWAQLWNAWVYGYAAGWVILFIGGVVCQYYLTREDKEEEGYKEITSNSRFINE